MHNVNEYMDLSSAELLKNLEADELSAVFTQKLGVVVSESQLEDFFSKISH